MIAPNGLTGGGGGTGDVDHNWRNPYGRSTFVDEVERISRRDKLPMKHGPYISWHSKGAGRNTLAVCWWQW